MKKTNFSVGVAHKIFKDSFLIGPAQSVVHVILQKDQ